MPASTIQRPINIVGGVVLLSLVISAVSYIPALNIWWAKPVDFLSALYSSTGKSNADITSLKQAPPAPPGFNAHDTLHLQKGFSAIENYYPDSNNRWAVLCEKLEALKQKKHGRIRIAWLGDSQIEGDIFTQDVRRLLQKQWGGYGVGFVPIATHVPGFRKSVDFSFSKEWQTYSLADKKTRHTKKLWALNGEVFIPEGEIIATDTLATDSTTPKPATNPDASAVATVHYKAIDHDFTNATLIYGDTQDTISFQYVLDKGIENTATLPATKGLTTYTIPAISSFKTLDLIMPVSANTCYYGVSFDCDNGVILDNYSLRGSAGLHLMAVNDNSLITYNKLLRYDLIVMQYGINVATTGIHNYDFYKHDMEKVIARLHKLLPHTAILLVGVSDRGTKHNGVYETMPEVREILALQKQLAQSTRCVFWSAFDAMGGDGSMIKWVDATPSLANKDYTHFKPEGGKVLAGYFYNTWLYDINKYAWLKKHPHD